MEIIFHLEIGIEECGWKKKAVCKTARRAHSQKIYSTGCLIETFSKNPD